MKEPNPRPSFVLLVHGTAQKIHLTSLKGGPVVTGWCGIELPSKFQLSSSVQNMFPDIRHLACFLLIFDLFEVLNGF